MKFGSVCILENLNGWDNVVIAAPSDLYTKKVDFLIFWGGADISPSFYGQQPNSFCGGHNPPSSRDKLEASIFKRASQLKLPMLGVCRGAQLLCALNGGKLIQHVTGHEGSHSLTTIEGESFLTSSSHHQMMDPRGTKYDLLAVASNPLSGVYLGEQDDDVDIPFEPEIVYFPETNCLCVQPHPEWESLDSPLNKYITKFLKERMLCM